MENLKMFSVVALIIYFAILLFAVTKEKKNNNVIDYFFAGRSLPFWALSITFIASWWGAGSAISTADLAYEEGIGAFWYYGVPVLISTVLMIILSKSIRRVGNLTQGSMMEERYSKKVAKMLSLMIFLFMTITAASQMVGIGDFFSQYIGTSYELGIIIATSIVLIYSLFGGFRGVVLTDIIQFVLLLISALIVFFVAMKNSGGLDMIIKSANDAGKMDYMNFFAGGKKYLSYVITFGCAWMIQANVWQRISAARNENDAKKMTIMSFFAYIPLYLIVVFTGMAGIALYDKMPNGGIVASIVTDYMNPVIATLVFIGISAAIMSTMDSLINTASMTIAMDLYKKDESDVKTLRVSKFATLFVTIIALIIALKIRSILDVSWIAADIITTGVFVPLIMGFIWKRGNSKGAFVSMLWGVIFCLYNLLISLGISLPVAWEMQSSKQVLIGVGISTIIYILVSIFSKEDTKKAKCFIEKAKVFKWKV